MLIFNHNKINNIDILIIINIIKIHLDIKIDIKIKNRFFNIYIIII